MKRNEDRWKELGVRKLRNFGFVNATVNNVLTDEVYRFYFIRFLQKNKEEEAGIEVFLNSLIKSCQNKDGVK